MWSLGELDLLDYLGVAWLLLGWIGYASFARRRARTTICIASAMHRHRRQWMREMLNRSNRVTDASLLLSLERNASFLASTAILIIAGLVTTLASLEKVYDMLAAVPFARGDLSPFQLQIKILVLLLVFVYAFFTLTWSMRQYGFCAALMGAAPERATAAQAEHYARYAAKVIDRAGHSYNDGLRAYYFSLAVLAWLLGSSLFMAAVAAVIAVLYGREFHSKTLQAMVAAADYESVTPSTEARTPADGAAIPRTADAQTPRNQIL